jgi:hypothetical protein
MNWDINFIAFFVFGLTVGLFDGWLWMQGRKTISERAWGINQHTLAFAFIFGLLAGHFFTVPK